MEFGMHILWNRHLEPRIWCSKYEEFGAKNIEGDVSTPSRDVQSWFEEVTIGDADKGPEQEAVDKEDIRDAVYEGKSEWTVFKYDENPRA